MQRCELGRCRVISAIWGEVVEKITSDRQTIGKGCVVWSCTVLTSAKASFRPHPGKKRHNVAQISQSDQ
jgi:hypothetical protein